MPSRPKKTGDKPTGTAKAAAAKMTKGGPRKGAARAKKSNLFVVGVGASAGGLEALRPFVANLPVSSNMAYVVVQHLSPQYRSMMVQLLARETSLKVVEIADDTKVEADTIYITPPNKDVRIRNGVLTLRQPSAPLGPKPSVDVFFGSLAEDRGSKAIGVILSGTGTDGSHGVRLLKANDGFTIAQNPDDAKYDGMPRAAMDTGCIDLILRPADMGRELQALARFPRPKVDEAAETEHSDSIREIFALVRNRTGIDFTNYKMTTIGRRLERRLAANRIATLDDYSAFVKRNPGELDLLCKDILISVTSFFRDTEAFSEVKDTLKDILKTKRPGDSIRLWVPGCATGEEAYSFAMMLVDHLGDDVGQFKIQIFATDIDMDAMAHARRGIYSETTLENLETEYVARYFDPLGASFQVKKAIREMVVFARQDLAKDPPFVKVDLISCRNLLIYFNADLQDKVLRLFHYALTPDGFLFLGKSESIGHNTEYFRAAKSTAKIFEKRLSSTTAAIPPMLRNYRPATPERWERETPRPEFSLREIVTNGFVQACMPPSVAVNDDLDILYFHGNVSAYMGFPEGTPHNNLGKLIHSDFRADLRALVHRAKKTQETYRGTKKKVNSPTGTAAVRMIVRPLNAGQYRDDIFLISWEEEELVDMPPSTVETATDGSQDAHALELEQELAATREHLQTVIEELETSNEELQALNEELQAANEELQSSNEELETSNEELQSTNEELTTVNQEIQVRTAELAAANADLNNIQEAMGFPLVVVDRELRLTRFTPPAVRLFSLLPSDIGQMLTSVPSHVQVPELKNLVNEVIRTGDGFEGEVGTDERIFRMRIAPYRTNRGDIEGAVLAFDDQTEIRAARRDLEKTVRSLQRTEKNLLAAKAQADQANRAKSDFLARMSHELRTPLNAVLGFSECISREMFGPMGNDTYREYAGIVHESGNHLLGLIDDVLDLSKIEAGKVELDERPVDLFQTVDLSLTMLRDRIAKSGVKVQSDLPDDLPKIRGDESALKRILINVVGNAIKFTDPGGKVTLKANNHKDGLRLVIADTGAGIHKADLERITEPFEQVRTGNGDNREGVGLGLSITRSLMELHEGEIRFDSTVSKGTTVTLQFPAKRLL